MKKIVFSLFVFASVFLGINSVSAELIDGIQGIYRGSSTGECMKSCSLAEGMTEDSCKLHCAASVYKEVGNCINGCSNVSDGACLKTCTGKYLDNYSFESITYSNKVATCTSVCRDITNLGGEECSKWCINYFPPSDLAEISRGKEYGNCMESCSRAQGTTEEKCHFSCSASVYTEVSGCMNSCQGKLGNDDKSCEKTCLSKYLDRFSFVSLTDTTKINTCSLTCRNMTGEDDIVCEEVCENYFFGNEQRDFKIWDRVQCGDLKMPFLFPVVVNTIINFIKILVPIILVILGSLDLGKAVMAQKDDEIKKGQQVFIRRLVIGIVVFITFALVQLVIGVVAPHNGNESMWDCIDCLVNKDCD